MPLNEAATAPASGLREPLLAFAAATTMAAALYWTGQVVPLVAENLHGGIALAFLFAPRVAARLSGRPFDYEAAGMHLRPLGLNLKVLALATVVAFPAFFVAFLAFYRGVCALIGSSALGQVADWMASNCVRWQGLSWARLDLGPDFALVALTQLVVIALPEELFFRGYLLSRLQERWVPTRRLFGAPVGRALLVASFLFALGHVLVDLNPQRIVVFFPALLFGWMRARTGSLAPGTVFHAMCNLYSELLHRAYFT